MNDFEKLQACFRELGLEFEINEDSPEFPKEDVRPWEDETRPIPPIARSVEIGRGVGFPGFRSFTLTLTGSL